MTVHTITPTSLADYLEAMSRAIYSSGISWGVVEAKWDDIKAAFDGFDPQTVSAYNPDDIDRLVGDPRVIRNRKKIEAIVANAGELIVVDREHGGMDKYLSSFDDNDALVKDLHKRFSFLGESVAHFFLMSVGYDMDTQLAWAKQHFGEHEYERHRQQR